MAASGVAASSECVSAFNELKLGKKTKWIVYKLADDKKSIVVEDKSDGADFEKFRETLLEKNAPRYAVYDFEFNAPGGEGKRNKIVFIAWSPDSAGVKLKMMYASSKDALKRSLNGVAVEIQANDQDEIEYDSILEKVGGKR